LSGTAWNALVLAAGRGPDDPMAKAYGVARKCMLPVGGVPMLERVIATLRASGGISHIAVSIEDEAALAGRAGFAPSQNSAPASALHAVNTGRVALPLLITTADHPLLTKEMVGYFLAQSMASPCDLAVGLATAEAILSAYPESKRTFLKFGPDRVSGCNLFAVKNVRALKALERWQYLDTVRKKPWRLVGAFGPVALLRFMTGALTLEKAFAIASKKLGLVAKPVLMPFAEAAIDVDKPADKDLAERILALR
jgi:molybdopterin-guanine dinucleotide biosynthesis protein A